MAREQNEMSREVSFTVTPTLALNHCRFSSTSVIMAMGASQMRAASSVRSSKTSSGTVSRTSYCQRTLSRCFSFRIGATMIRGDDKGQMDQSKFFPLGFYLFPRIVSPSIMARTERHRIQNREEVAEMPEWMKEKHCPHKKKYMAGKRIQPRNLTGKEKLSYLVDETFLAYNSARLKEACHLFARRMLDQDVTIGMSISGALTPAGLGCSSIIPLIKAGFVDWIVSTGANLYHEMHFALNYPVHSGSFKFDDTDLRDNDLVRIYDVVIPYSDGLMATDELLRELLIQPEFQKEMGTAELHYLIGRYCAEWERKNKLKDVSVLAAAYRAGVPCYTSSPGDSTIGMNVAGVELRGNKLRVNPSIDVNETTAFVLAAKRANGRSGVVLWGGGR